MGFQGGEVDGDDIVVFSFRVCAEETVRFVYSESGLGDGGAAGRVEVGDHGVCEGEYGGSGSDLAVVTLVIGVMLGRELLLTLPCCILSPFRCILMFERQGQNTQ